MSRQLTEYINNITNNKIRQRSRKLRHVVNRIPNHYDSIHYCDGGLFRAILLLIEIIIENKLSDEK